MWRLHRQHRTGRYVVVPATVATVAAGVGTLVLLAHRSPLTGLPALIVAAGWVAVVVVAHTGRARYRQDRHSVAVTGRGLLVWHRDPSAATPIPWAELGPPIAPVYGGVRWRDSERGGWVSLAGVCGAGDVVRAVRRGGPIERWTVRRVLGPALGVVALALVAWLAGVPVASYAILGERPHQLADLGRICNGGKAFRGAATYRRRPDPPLAVFEYGRDDPAYVDIPVYQGGGATDATAARAQLVVCVRYLGHGRAEPLQTCRYTGGVTWTTYQGRWRMAAYQAKTGARVAAGTVDGTTGASGCQSMVPHAEGTSRRVEVDTSPPYRAALASLLDR